MYECATVYEGSVCVTASLELGSLGVPVSFCVCLSVTTCRGLCKVCHRIFMTPQVPSLCVLLHIGKALHQCDSGACEVYPPGVALCVLLWVEP